jgi:DNA-binding response OmpR family regulator
MGNSPRKEKMTEMDDRYAEPARRILIVDDDPDVRRFIATKLQALGYELHEAGNGDDGLADAITLLPVLVLSDVTHPGLNGFELTRRLRSDPRTRSIPIILLTAKSLPEDRAMGLAAGADAYLTKPFTMNELVDEVRRLLPRGTPGFIEERPASEMGRIVIEVVPGEG